MKLHDLRPSPGSKTKKKRVGRGPSSGRGKTAGKGHKGLLARAGRANMVGFEGGQMPLIRRLPKRGFVNPFRTEYAIVNLKALTSFEAGQVITPQVLRESGLVKGQGMPVKILGEGEVECPLIVEAHRFSASARAKIEQKGGQARVIQRA